MSVLVATPDPPLADDAVALRLWTPGDVGAVVAACTDPEVPRWTTIPDPYTRDHARAWLEEVSRPEREDAATLAVTERATGAVVGAVSVWIVRPDVGELGYWATPALRGRGYTTRAVRLLSRWALDELRLERLQLGTLPGNTSSERVAEKAGFRREGVLRSWIEQRGERRDVLMWSLLPGELG